MIGIFGGSFDPVHEGHIDFARRALTHYGLETIYFVPANRNPLKDGAPAPAEARIEMVRRALQEAGEPRFRIDDDEAHAPGPSYTVFTIDKHVALCGKPVCLLIGNEVFAGLDRWFRPKDILKDADVVIAAREADLPADIPGVLKKIGIGDVTPDPLHPGRFLHSGGTRWVELFPFPALPISGTAIRAALQANPAVVPPGIQRTVWQFVQENRLYTVK